MVCSKQCRIATRYPMTNVFNVVLLKNGLGAKLSREIIAFS